MRTKRLTVTIQERVLLPVELAAELLGISRTSAYALIRKGELRSVLLGGRRLVPRAAVDELAAHLIADSERFDAHTRSLLERRKVS